MNSTATGARNENTINIITFRDQEHEKFYFKYLMKCKYQDDYNKSLIYCLGINSDTRMHMDRIYDFETGMVKEKCLQEGWQTSGSIRTVRMAFNLYCNGTPSVDRQKNAAAKLRECQCYTVEEIFCCEYARYFWEAVKLRYPEYCL